MDKKIIAKLIVGQLNKHSQCSAVGIRVVANYLSENLSVEEIDNLMSILLGDFPEIKIPKKAEDGVSSDYKKFTNRTLRQYCPITQKVYYTQDILEKVIIWEEDCRSVSYYQRSSYGFSKEDFEERGVYVPYRENVVSDMHLEGWLKISINEESIKND